MTNRPRDSPSLGTWSTKTHAQGYPLGEGLVDGLVGGAAVGVADLGRDGPIAGPVDGEFDRAGLAPLREGRVAVLSWHLTRLRIAHLVQGRKRSTGGFSIRVHIRHCIENH
jgi:hypothetical protein